MGLRGVLVALIVAATAAFVVGVAIEEAWPFVALAAAASLALAAAALARPRAVALLGLVAVAMLAFAVLDIREVVHQRDEDNTGLAVVAGSWPRCT